ncbi:MAG: hypothetical protein R2717_09315 [Schumannella sp.]
MPSQALVSRPGSSTGAFFFGSFFVACERVDEPREPVRARVFEDRVLVAMQRRYPRPPAPPGCHADQ